MDQHVPSAVTQGLRIRGVDVVTAQDGGTSDWDDERLLSRANKLRRVFYSQDRDFLAIANNCLNSGRDFPGLVYAHQLSITIGQAVNELELIAIALDIDDMRNTVQFIPL
jgi:hypothetical protein